MLSCLTLKSYISKQAGKGWVESSGYEVRCKTLGAMATCAADWLVKA